MLLRGLPTSSESESLIVTALTSSTGTDPWPLIAQRALVILRSRLLDDEGAARQGIASDKDTMFQRMLHHFNIEKRVFAETDLTMCVFHERTRRRELTWLERTSFDVLSLTVHVASIPQLLVLTQVQHTRRACLIWLAQSLGRAELLHRMRVVVQDELAARRDLMRLQYTSLGAASPTVAANRAEPHRSNASAGTALPPRTLEAVRLQHAQRSHEALMLKLQVLSADRATGSAAAKVHALLSAQQAARMRIVWDEELQFRALLRF